jgi:hypothetical protein
MGHQFAELPRWEFTVDEESPGIYRVKAVRDGGITGEACGSDSDPLLDDLKQWAHTVDRDFER